MENLTDAVIKDRSIEVIQFFKRLDGMEKELFKQRPEFAKLFNIKERMQPLFENNIK